jgi:Icc-related predicted phosphoesterase
MQDSDRQKERESEWLDDALGKLREQAPVLKQSIGNLALVDNMKILITADLHYRSRWFDWLLEQGPNFDLICIAGDLLDMFDRTPRSDQAREISISLRRLAKKTWVAICSGNHDCTGRQVSRDRAPIYEWLAQLDEEPRIVTDGATRVIEDLIVTTLPYHCYQEQKSVWLDRGASVRRSRSYDWLVLHHIPPVAYPGSTKEEAEAAELLAKYQPDYILCGHSHQFPYFAGRSWSMKIGNATVLIPGQVLSAGYPNHVVLDTKTRDAGWRTSHETWVAEDGLFDHLVLKMPK